MRRLILVALAGCHPSSPVRCEAGSPEIPWHETSGNSASPRLVPAGDRWLAVWEENDAVGPGQVLARPLDAAGEPLGDPTEVGALRAWGAQPRVASTGDGAVAVWLVGPEASSNGCGPLAGRTLGADGGPATAEAWLEGSEDASCHAPAVAWTGDHAVVVWVREADEDQQDLWSVTLSPTGGWGEPRRLTTDGLAGGPQAAWIGDEVLLTWIGGQGPIVAHLDAEGGLVGAPAPLLDDPTPRYAVPLAWGGAPAVVFDARPAEGDARAMVVRPGEEQDPPVPISPDRGSVNDLAAATDGTLLAAVWSDDRGNQIRASVVDADGLLAGDDLELGAGDGGMGLQPTASATPEGFLTLWRDTRDHPGGDLYLRTVRCE